MDKAYFLDLLKKYREGTATAAEEKFLLSCYDAFEPQPDIVALLTDAERERLKGSLHSGIMEQIALHEKAAKKTVPTWLKIAAAVIVLVGAAGIGMWLVRKPASLPVATAQQTVQPTKENNFIALPDGSSVLVSAGSRLQFPSSFNGLPTREVYLEGQALFTVQQHTSQPFIVHTGKLQTTVLGTTFEINAPAGGDITVTVLRGKVQVARQQQTLAVLSANERIVYNTAGNHQQMQLNAAAPAAWRQQDLLFDDVTLQQACGLLEERFNITISIPDETLQQQRFTTSFAKDEDLEQVLKSICAFHQAAYRIDREKNTVIIYLP